MIQLGKPDRDADPEFDVRVGSYIEQNRNHIIADALAVLADSKHRIDGNRSRYPEWDSQVLATDPLVNEVLSARQEGVQIVDIDRDEIELFLKRLKGKWGEEESFSFPPSQLTGIWNEALNSNLQTNWVMRKLYTAHRQGKLAELRPASKEKGCSWINETAKGKVKFTKKKRSKQGNR